MNIGKQLKEGLLTQNPVLVQMLGLCSTMAITTSIMNGLGMGVSVLIILMASNVVISFVPAIAESLGVFIPLIVVNCIILGRAEAFSYKNGVGASFFDGIFQGLGYTLVLLAMCFIRELLGAGTLAGFRIIPEQFPIGILTLPVGGFLVLGFLIAAMQWALSKSKEGK